MFLNDYCTECGIPLDPDECWRYCPTHRLNNNGCCKDHCLIEVEGVERHCYDHCDPTDSDSTYCENCGNRISDGDLRCEFCVREAELSMCENCGDDINPDEGPICELCTEHYNEIDMSVTATDENNYFHALYQRLAPTTEEQKQRLTEIKVQLCEECKMPCEFIWCNDCSFD